MPNPSPFRLTCGTAVIAESLDALPVNPKPSQLMPCGHPQSAVISSNPDDIGTCYCGECAKENDASQ